MFNVGVAGDHLYGKWLYTWLSVVMSLMVSFLCCPFSHKMFEWIDDFRFYVLLTSISVISGRWEVDNERLCAMELRLLLKRFRLERDRNRSARSAG